nr:YqeG family HAD IIIA-type phosphatase [bacterium]
MWNDYYPTHRAKSLSQIDADMLADAGVQAVLLDMDNTLATWKGGELAPDAQAFVRRLHEDGMRVAVFSNNQPKKVQALADRLGIDVAIARAGKPSVKAFLRAADIMGVPPQKCAAIGDQLMTDIAGANRAGFAAAILIPPLSRVEWIFTKYNRMRERIILYFTKQEQNR